jgi:hypothetical protein
MRRTDLLTLVAGLVWLLALALIAAERRIVRRLRSAGALMPQNAIPIAQRSALTRFRLARLLRSGAVVAAGGRYYLDPAAFALYRGRRRRRAFILISSVLAIGAIFWVLRGR